MSYVITNGQAYLTKLKLEGTCYGCEFTCGQPILFKTEIEAHFAMCLALGIDEDNQPLVGADGWQIKELMKVKVRQVTGRVSRDYADEFLKKAKYRRSDSRFYCEDCSCTSHPGYCMFVAAYIGDSFEYCTYFEPKSEVENSVLVI